MFGTAHSVCPPRRRAAVLLTAGLLTAMVAGSTTYAASSVAEPEPGAAGIGDPYFPLDGNGGIDVVEYDIHDRYRFGQRRLSGWTLLTVRATRDLSRFNLDLLLPVRTVKVDGEPARHAKANSHELQVTPATPILEGTQFRVMVAYTGYPERIDWRGERNWLADRGEVVTMNEPHMAPWWFPANDHPRDKAVMDIRVTVPKRQKVIANGRRISRSVHGRLATVRWRAGKPMAPYNAFFAAGSFAVEKGVSQGLPWYSAVSNQVSPPSRRAAMRMLKQSPRIVRWLSSHLGDYPFSTTGGVVTDLNPGFALENQTRPIYPLIGAGATSLVVHELAHQWFGDSVSVENWRDIWLNEGAATFMEVVYDATHDGPPAQEWLLDHYENDGRFDRFWDLTIGEPGADAIFDNAVYVRGAMTFQALRHRLGEAAFWELVQTWTTQYADDNGSTEEFRDLAEEVSGEDLGGFFDAWLFSGERPAPTADNGVLP